MTDKKTEDAIAAAARFLHLHDGAETVPPPPAFITPDCIPHSRWEERNAARATGRPWTWLEHESRHIPTCAFCRRMDQLIPSVSDATATTDQDSPASTSRSHRETTRTFDRALESFPSAEVRADASGDVVLAGYRRMVRTAVRSVWGSVHVGSRQEFVAAVIQRLFDADELPSGWERVFWPLAAAEIRILIRERAEEAAARVNQWSTANESTITGTANPAAAIARDDAWRQLSRTYPQRAHVAELRLFAELPTETIEAVTGLSREVVVCECSAVKYKFAAFES